jgi:RNA polymerase sigma-70 factor, ECF subfamily
MDNLSHETLRQAAQGDIQAFEKIYKTYASFVYNVAFRLVATREDAEEITQEVFLIIHRKLNSFMFRSSLKTWVYRVTANCALNFLNKRNKEQKGRVGFDDVLATAASPNEVRVKMESEDQGHKVKALLNTLNPDERACVVLRNIEGLSYQDIARSLNVNLNTVRTRLKRAREKMLKAGKEVVNT